MKNGKEINKNLKTEHKIHIIDFDAKIEDKNKRKEELIQYLNDGWEIIDSQSINRSISVTTGNEIDIYTKLAKGAVIYILKK